MKTSRIIAIFLCLLIATTACSSGTKDPVGSVKNGCLAGYPNKPIAEGLHSYLTGNEITRGPSWSLGESTSAGKQVKYEVAFTGVKSKNDYEFTMVFTLHNDNHITVAGANVNGISMTGDKLSGLIDLLFS